MKVADFMTKQVVTVDPAESVEVASRMLTQYNIGALPVCNSNGRLQGIVTDRDLVTRCMAANRDPTRTYVREVMTNGITTVTPETDLSQAAALMAKQQVRRLPVVEGGMVCGMVSLGDVARQNDSIEVAANTLFDISSNIRK